MRFGKRGRSILAAVMSWAAADQALADVEGNMTVRYMINAVDKVSSNLPPGDNAINNKKAEASGFFRNSNYPGWYGGFYLGRELDYGQGFEAVGPNDFRNSIVSNSNTIVEAFAGKTYSGDFGEMNAEVMVGHETQYSGIKYRPKLSGRYEFANGVSIFGYGNLLVQTYQGPSQSVSVNREFLETEIQPGVGYKLNDDMGVFVNRHMRDRRQQRALYGPMKEKEYWTELGLWKNFGDLYTQFKWRTGTFQLWDLLDYQVDTVNHTLRNDRINRYTASVSMPLADKLRGAFDFGYQVEKYSVINSGAVTHLREPVVILSLNYAL